MSTNTIPETHLTDIESYVMASDIPIINVRRGGRQDQSTILTYADGTEWVFLSNKEKERFCGFLYMQNAIKEAGLAKVKAAQNKMAIIEDEQHGRKIIYLSQYCGEKKPEIFDYTKEFSGLQTDVGFTDTVANLREIEGEVYVFDTEKSSFAKGVHSKIDAFVKTHEALRSALEEKLKDPSPHRDE
ncbi:MAG TPA: hypothetical protein VIJ14_06160 [Rhabdochlamydiaceae bacterium]